MTSEPTVGSDIQKRLGTFWSRHFTGKGTLQAFLDSVVLAYEQTKQNMLEAQATLDRQNLPLYHRELLYPLRLKYSSGDDLDYNKIKYGSGILYGGGSSYGDLISFVPVEVTSEVAARIEARRSYRPNVPNRRPVYPLPVGLKRIGLLTNRLTSPSVVMVNGIDFVVDDNVIVFKQEPFNLAEVPQLELYDSTGIHYDDEILLWATAVDFDLEYVYNHLGYVLNIRGSTSAAYRDVLNLVWDCLQEGFTGDKFRQILSTVSGIPIAKADEEVRILQQNLTTKTIVTDKNVYSTPITAVTSLFVGKQLAKGDLLTDGIQIVEPAGMDKDIPNDFDALVLGRGFIGTGYLSTLSFPNKDVSLDYIGIDSNGYPEVRFEVHGFPGDVLKFWEDVHKSGVSDNKVLANYLDIRPDPEGQPGIENLPSTINPAQFLVSNLLGDNLIFVKLKLAEFTETPDKITYLGLIRQLLPAHTAFLLYLDAPSSLEYISSADSTLELEGLIVEDGGITVSEIQAADDQISGSMLSDYVSARLVAGSVV